MPFRYPGKSHKAGGFSSHIKIRLPNASLSWKQYNNCMELNKYSKTLTQDTTQPAAQAMLYGIGLTDEDLAKAQVGIVSMGYDGNTCNMHLNDLAQVVKKGVWDQDLIGLIFNPIGVSDGMSMGTDGMRY